MSTPNESGWSITVTTGMGGGARVEVFDPTGKCMASCGWLPTPASAFGWGLGVVRELQEKQRQIAPMETD